MNRNNLMICFLIALMAMPVFGGKRKRRKPQSYWYFKVTSSALYDNNILKYSDKYLNRFENNEDEGRFHINTYDDLISENSIYISHSFYRYKRYRSNIHLKFQHKWYTGNQIKNWSFILLGFNQRLPHYFKFNFSYSYIPDYYVRHFRDDDWVEIYGYEQNTFQPFSFKKDNFAAYVEKRIVRGTSLRFNIGYMRYYHNRHFTEYDSKNLDTGFELIQSLGSNLEFRTEYSYMKSNATGYDEPGESSSSSDDSNASYVQDQFKISVNYRFPRLSGFRSNLDLQGRYEPRYYRSKKEAQQDKLHVGREDKVLRFMLVYNVALTRNLDISAVVNWFNRKSGTSIPGNDSYVADEKQYNQYQAGLEISYSFKK